VPKVSIIIPTYNRAQFIAEAIQSVLDQTFQDFELLIVDDGSTDNTREIVGSFKDQRIKYIHQENRGVSAARNNGILASSGEYIAFLDSDDLWLPQSLELKVRSLDSHPDAALVCSDLELFDNDTGARLGSFWHGSISRFSLKRVSKQPLNQLLTIGCFIGPQATLIRRRVFSDVGYFDESLRSCGDWDMFVRILKRFLIDIIDIPLTKLRRHGYSMWSTGKNIDENYQNEVYAINKVINSDAFTKAEIALAKKRLARVHFSYGCEKLRSGNTALAREKLLASVKYNPWRIRPYIYIVLTFLGRRGFLTLNHWRKAVMNRPARAHPGAGD
jgi:glycosyltransferase involved in cell wall biosynthesis